MTQAWYQYPTSQAYGQNGEEGIDLATPFHTPITALFGGTVRWAGRTQWACGSSGGEVTIVCNIPGKGVLTSYYLHLDTVAVNVNDTVNPGQLIGLSGGQTSGGQWPVINCPQKGITYSTGPHIEFGFNASWVSGPGYHIDPTPYITMARNGNLPIVNPGGSQTVTTTLGDTTGSGSSPQPITIDATAIESGVLAYANLESKVHKTINQPNGFDGICMAIDNSEQFAVWNWYNPVGSIIADFRPLAIRVTVMFIAGVIMALVLWQYVKGPLQSAGRLGAMIAAPEAAPAMSAAASASNAASTTQPAPMGTAK